MDKKILVTGGSGFIGSNFIRFLMQKYPEVKVINLDLLAYNQKNDNLADIEKKKNYSFVKEDICDRKLVENLMKKSDIVVHFAAQSHVDRSIIDSTPFVRTNVLGTQVLLDLALKHNIELFYHISTDEVFGSLGKTGSFSEKSHYDPRSPYAASKAAADHLVRAYYHTHKLPIVISNCSNNYGPFQYPEKIIPLFITNLLRNKKVPVYGKGENIRDWLHVLDHCEAIELILTKGKIGETYCVGGGFEINNLELAKAILRMMGKKENMISFVEDRKGHDFRYSIDSSKIKKELGWKPKHDFHQGLKQTIKWYEQHPKWWQHKIF